MQREVYNHGSDLSSSEWNQWMTHIICLPYKEEGTHYPLVDASLNPTRVVGHDHTGKYSLSCIIPHCLFSVIYASCLFLVSCCTALYAHAIALWGGNTTPPFVADAFLSSVSRLQV
jgi:hypothetical protein